MNRGEALHIEGVTSRMLPPKYAVYRRKDGGGAWYRWQVVLMFGFDGP
jgi:hypothetical protein